MKYDADAAVIGLGTMGSLASWRLAAAGLSVVGFEQFGLAHDRGAAGGDLRRVATHSMGDPREVPIVQRSLALWRALEEETGTSLGHRPPGRPGAHRSQEQLS